MVEETFRERQSKTIEERRDIEQQIKILKIFLSLYKNSQLIEIAKSYSLLATERDQKIELEQNIISENLNLNEYEKIKKKQQSRRNIRRQYWKGGNELIKKFFDLARQLIQGIVEFDGKDQQTIIFLSKNCFDISFKEDSPINPSEFQKTVQSMEKPEEKLLISALFSLMEKKHASQEFAKKIKLLIEEIKEYNNDLRDEFLELLANIAENNFEEQEETNKKTKSEINQHTQEIQKNKGEISAVKTKTDQNTEKVGKLENNLEVNNKRIDSQEQRITILQENQQTLWNKVFSKKETSHNIYDFDTYYHWIGWYVFLLFSGYIARKVYRIKTRKRKESKNYLVEIRKIFKEWQLNMYASTGGYVVGFYLIKEAIEKWINPRISNWLITQKLITLSVVCLIIGAGFYIDGIITSSLKTPLQRLGIRIENANIDEKTKRSLLSKTQQVNELFKETLKRFGLLAVVGILTKLIEAFWNKNILTLLSYAVPIAGAIKIIWEVDKSLKKLKLRGQ